MKIYVRGRQKVGEGVHQPQFRVMAVMAEKDKHVHIEAAHFRKVELEQMAQDMGAEIVYLEPVPKEERGSMKD
ncbi:MAG: hypothetical protein ACP5C4_02990 [Methanomicrobiales archaeon]